MVVMLYKITTNTELVNIDPLVLRNTELGSCELQGAIFLSTNQYVTLFYVFLFKGTLFNMYC